MANVADYVRIVLASEFKAKGFNDADKAVNKLNKSVKNLAKGFGLAYGSTALLRYSKDAVKAFAADNNAARSLSLTLDNLGLAYGGAAKSVNEYISTLEKQTGVLDDELRPAMDRFLRATYDVTKSQELLSLALDISAGTGKDLTTVSQALQKAYLGQTQSLGRLGVGLSKAELTNSSFLKIQEKLTALFQGQAMSAADSYQGSLNKLTVAANNAKETIGKGLVDALAGAGGNGGLNATLNMVEKSAQAVSDLLVGIGRTIGAITAGSKSAFSGKGFLSGFSSQSAAYRQQDLMARQQYGGAYAVKYQKEAAAAAKKQQAALKAQTTSTKALTKAQQDALKEKKLAGLFDIQQAEIMAALQGKITNEEKLRLELMLALETGNTAEAEKLSQRLGAAQGQLSILSLYLRTLPDAKNPFASWSDYLKTLEDRIKAIGQIEAKAGQTPLTLAEFQIASPQAQERAAALEASTAAAAAEDALRALLEAERQAGIAGLGGGASQNVTITVEGGDELTTLMRYKIAEASSSGSGVNWSQTVGAYDR